MFAIAIESHGDERLVTRGTVLAALDSAQILHAVRLGNGRVRISCPTQAGGPVAAVLTAATIEQLADELRNLARWG